MMQRSIFGRPLPELVATIAFVALIFVVMFPLSPSGNEEQYFPLAHQTLFPDQYTALHAAFDRSPSRWLAWFVMGLPMELVGFDAAFAAWRLMLAALLSWSLLRLLDTLGASRVISLAVLAVFLFLDQSFFGQEWIVRGVEAKVFAYVGVFIGLRRAIAADMRWATVAFVIATYFHFLVGGFWFAAVLVYMGIRGLSSRELAIFLLIYSIMIAPILAALAIDRFDTGLPASMVKLADYFYAQRVAHHVLPFLQFLSFKWGWIPGIIGLGASSAALFALRRYGTKRAIIDWILCLNFYLILAIFLSFIDRSTYIISKYYLFRPASLILLLNITEIVIGIKHFFDKSSKKHLDFRLAIIGMSCILPGSIFTDLISNAQKARRATDLAELHAVVERRIPSGAVVLVAPGRAEWNAPYASLHRILERPTLASEKFLPSRPDEVIEWHRRLAFRQAVFDDPCNRPPDYPVSAMVTLTKSDLDRMARCGTVAYRRGDVGLILFQAASPQAKASYSPARSGSTSVVPYAGSSFLPARDLAIQN